MAAAALELGVRDVLSIGGEPQAGHLVGSVLGHDDLSGGELELAVANDREAVFAGEIVRQRLRELESLWRVGRDELPRRPSCQRHLGDCGWIVAVEDSDRELSRLSSRLYLSNKICALVSASLLEGKNELGTIYLRAEITREIEVALNRVFVHVFRNFFIKE